MLYSISAKQGYIDALCSIYFYTFHRSLPIINKNAFYYQLQRNCSSPQFSILLLSIVLVTHLSTKVDRLKTSEELFIILKGIFSLLQSSSQPSTEIIQAGLLIASYEHCQALHLEAWLSIGACARMGYALGLHQNIKSLLPTGEISRDSFETRRCLWWGIVVLERYI
jgi:Fungal specific transcription factor domain